MASRTRKNKASPFGHRSVSNTDGSYTGNTLEPGWFTNPSTGKPSKGSTGALRRADEERSRVLERAQRSIKKPKGK